MLFKIPKQILTRVNTQFSVKTNKANFEVSIAAAFSSVNVRLPWKKKNFTTRKVSPGFVQTCKNQLNHALAVTVLADE